VRSGPFLAIAALAAALLLLPAAAQAASAPPAKTVTRDGPVGRYLMDGRWLFRSDPKHRGERSFPRQRSSSGWRGVSVPSAWNANVLTNASMRGSNVWYRRDFRLPSAGASDWIVRFESIRYRAKVWLNGRFIGSHEGAYVPFELHMTGLKRGTNRLVVEVDNKTRETDLPAAGKTVVGDPNGGWWNWGGILRDVYIRRVNGIDISQAQVLPTVKGTGSSASLLYRVTVRNYRRRAARVRVSTQFGSRSLAIGSTTVPAGGAKQVTRKFSISNPRLWSPPSPYLYPVKIVAAGGGSASWSLHIGVRQFTVKSGHLMLNGKPVNFRGGFMHEDDPVGAGAVTKKRMDQFFALSKQIGSTMFRTHYPLNPYIQEQADRRGFLIWSEVPVYQVNSQILVKREVRKRALALLRENILANSNHASVFTWSIANELHVPNTYVESNYYRAATKVVRHLDPTRPVALATPGYPQLPCQSAFKKIDLLGVNTYFGWYPGPAGAIADKSALGPYLDKMRACYPKQAIAVTEFGAEGNRDGPPEDRGTFAFQANLNDYDLSVYAQKPWLSGAVGMLIEFRVRPGWMGGNPFSSPPMHQKAVFDFKGNPKPAAAVLSRWYHQTLQYDPGS
jgi:beta-galactosidase/beta-glucuronidase